jgi:signal peptidase I
MNDETKSPDNRGVSDIFEKEKEQIPQNNKIPEIPAEEPKELKGGFVTLLLDIGLNLLIVFGLVFVIQTFIASPFKVYGPSMCDTINNIDNECLYGYGEYIIVNKLIYQKFFGWSLSEPSRGDIIVFHPPTSQEQFYIKRIIGVYGDTIKLIDGKVYLFNNEHETGYELPEPYLNATNSGNTLPSTNRITTFNVPEGQYLVMGDNRNQSTDSRSCFRDAYEGGCRGEEAYFLPKENIEGKASVVLWPLNKIRTLKSAEYF